MRIDFKQELLKDLSIHKEEVFAKYQAKVFQTQREEYGEGDFFWGIRVLNQRSIAVKYYKYMSLKDTEELLQHNIHEVRFITLIILIEMYKKANNSLRLNIMQMYLRNFKYINNWDLVDLSAPRIPGHYWYESSLKDLWRYARDQGIFGKREQL
jgi:hypothetical protein